MIMQSNFHTIRFVFGDQLNARHSWFKKTDDDILYIIAELKQETNYVKHHIQKVCGFFFTWRREPMRYHPRPQKKMMRWSLLRCPGVFLRSYNCSGPERGICPQPCSSPPVVCLMWRGRGNCANQLLGKQDLSWILMNWTGNILSETQAPLTCVKTWSAPPHT